MKELLSRVAVYDLKVDADQPTQVDSFTLFPGGQQGIFKGRSLIHIKEHTKNFKEDIIRKEITGIFFISLL